MQRCLASKNAKFQLVSRGKLLNVRDASTTQISGNTEIQNIKQIMGLQHGKVRLAHAPDGLIHASPAKSYEEVTGLVRKLGMLT